MALVATSFTAWYANHTCIMVSKSVFFWALAWVDERTCMLEVKSAYWLLVFDRKVARVSFVFLLRAGVVKQDKPHLLETLKGLPLTTHFRGSVSCHHGNSETPVPLSLDGPPFAPPPPTSTS